jgi:twitching motility protein PilJ
MFKKKNGLQLDSATFSQPIDNEGRKYLLSKVTLKPLVISASIAFMLSGAFYTKYSNEFADLNQKFTYISDVATLTERIEKNSLLVLKGEKGSFKQLNESNLHLGKILKVFKSGGSLDGDNSTESIAAISNNYQKNLDKILEEWNRNNVLVSSLIENQEDIMNLKIKVDDIQKGSSELLMKVSLLQRELSKDSAVSNVLSQELSILSEKIISNLKLLFAGNGISVQDGYMIVKDLRSFEALLDNLKNGSAVFSSSRVNVQALEKLLRIEKDFEPYKKLTNDLEMQIGALTDIKDVSSSMRLNAKNIGYLVKGLNDNLKNGSYYIGLYKHIALLCLLISLIIVVIIFLKMNNRSVGLKNLAKVLQKNQNNEMAVQQLFKKVEYLEQGDLSKPIEIEDKFLSKMAEVLDKARLNLSNIVTDMKKASTRVLDIADSTNVVALKLNKDSTEQIEELTSTIENIGNITSDLDDIAQSTWGAKELANSSKENAEKGEFLVSTTIEHMDGVRVYVQETSKKIKKLGESAQTINEVVEIIREITKKIHILSLNSAIHAASSQSSTREFTILAKEVQSLAKESELATSKIELLVIDIQSDTSSVIEAMEETTKQIVDVTQLSYKAGEALKEIGEVSKKVALQIEQTSERLEKKSDEMALIALAMDKFRVVAERTTESTLVSTRKATDLQNIANKINQSIESYKT